jgi:P-type Cu2+ transporter
MLIVFLLVGRTLDHAMRRKTRAFAANLSALRAPVASRIGPDGEMTAVPVAALAAGDLVLVSAGERIPVDGIVVSGRSEIDQSFVTGETACKIVLVGSEVYAGTLNYSGALRIRARAVAGGTLLDEIDRLMESAATQKTHYVRLADRAARFYAPVVHATAILTAIGWLLAGASAHDAIVTAITVLIITCPCALALAVPAVQVVAAGALFRSRVLLNAGDAIERMAGIDTVVFDKTGTLTFPEPWIDNVDEAMPQIVERAARLALSSHHPLACALATLAIDCTPFEECHESPGEGVRAMIGGIEARLGGADFCNLESETDRARGSNQEASVIAFRHGAASAIFRVHQKLRPDALSVIQSLRSRGLAIMILSGDRASAVKACADALGLTEWRAQLKPADKVAVLTELKAQGRKVLMVGDGMNDAPALASAYVSLSPVTASGITQAAADALFLGDRLAPVGAAIDIACRATTLMRQNLWFAVLYNSIAVPLAISGFVTPLIAAAAMSGSSVIVTLNALRARRAGLLHKPSSLEPMLSPASGPHHLNKALP